MGGIMTTGSRLSARAMRIGAVAALVATAGVVPLAPGAGASTTTYSGTGYDVSYPQGKFTPPSGASFAIIGVTHGRPFTTNQYAGYQWSHAGTTSTSLYFNTGYALAYAKSDTANCKTDSSVYIPTGTSGHTLSALQAAWAIGCSEADYAVSNQPGIPAMWWADVETGNSWSNDTALNQATITGMVTELGQNSANSGIQVGIYSTPSMWASITGSNFVVSGVSGDWWAGLSTCPSTTTGSFTTNGFTLTGNSSAPYAPVLVAQNGTTTSGTTTYDTDLGCG